MEFMKKFQIGSGLQNFHIRTPLLATRDNGFRFFKSKFNPTVSFQNPIQIR